MPETILIIDDEPDVLLLCRVNLEFEGYHVVEATDGERGLIAVDAEKPDLILLDVMMPGLDGWHVLATLRSNESTKDIPIVMLTAKAQESDQMRGLTQGAVDFVTKPFNPVALSRTVREALQAQASGDQERRRMQMLQKLRLVETL